jgi:TM2 domain-containing membrane protein YozV
VNQEWYYSVNGDRQGPVAAAELKKLADAGTLKPADLVWKDGMADWAPAKSIKGLFAAGAGTPAPASSKSGEQAAARPRTDEADAADRPSRRPRRDEEEDDRPAARRRRDEDDEDDRPSGRVRRGAADDEDEEDRPVRRRRDDDVDEDRPRKRRGRVPDDVSSKKMVAGILGILIGGLGIHKFYLGMTGAGLTMLLVTVLTCGIGGMVMGIIGLVEGIMYLIKSDEDFYQTYVVEQKAWF